MDHLAQDLSLALEDSEPCGPTNFKLNRRWGIKRRTRSAGNLHLCVSKTEEVHSDDSSSSGNETRMQHVLRTSKHHASFHQSDSDDTTLSLAVSQALQKTSTSTLRMKTNIPAYLTIEHKCGPKALSYSLESDSFNENSPVRPSIRRKRKLKRMCVDETPVPPCGKRKRPQRIDAMACSTQAFKTLNSNRKLKSLQRSVLDKLEKICTRNSCVNDDQMETNADLMETQYADGTIDDVASESSLSWSGDEGHEGDDELTDWGGGVPDPPLLDCWPDGSDPREIRAGCRRLQNERPGFTIATGANERVARFLQDTTRFELRLCGAEREKLRQLAALYSLDLWFDGTNSLLRKTSRTPCMQPTQRHHSGCTMGHKKIRTQESKFI